MTRRRQRAIIAPEENRNSLKMKTTAAGSFEVGTILWTKYSEYPDWPAMVSADPDLGVHIDNDEVHVKFFETPSSRAWVKINGTRPYKKGSFNLSKNHSFYSELSKACQDADMATAQDLETRKAWTLSEKKKKRKRKDDELDSFTASNDTSSISENSESKSSLTNSDSSKMVKSPAKKKVKTEKENLNEEGLSEYELLRLRNIQQRMNMFQELKLHEAKNRLSDINQKSQQASRRGLASVKKEKEILPARKSLRLQNIDADTGLKLPEKEPTMYFQPEDDHPRLPIEELTLDDVCKEEDVQQNAKFLKDLHLKENPNQASFNDVPKAIREIKITSDQVAKVVPDRIFSMSVHPDESKLLVAAGGKWGGLGLWDVMDRESAAHGVHLFTPHSRPINSLGFSPFDSNRLVSTSYDGTCRYLDIQSQTVQLIYADPVDEDLYLNYHQQLDAHTFMLTLGRTGLVGLVDTRESNTKRAKDLRVFDRLSGKTVSIHPTAKDKFLVPNQKAFCGIFDLRQAKKNQLMKPLVTLEGHSKAISSAFFSPVTGDQVLTVSYDNRIRLFDVNTSASVLRPSMSLAHNNQTGRWLTTFKAEWHPRREDLFICGSMQQPRQIDLYNNKGFQYPALRGECLASVCSIVKFHPTRNIVVGGNSSGRVHVFM